MRARRCHRPCHRPCAVRTVGGIALGAAAAGASCLLRRRIRQPIHDAAELVSLCIPLLASTHPHQVVQQLRAHGHPSQLHLYGGGGSAATRPEQGTAGRVRVGVRVRSGVGLGTTRCSATTPTR